MHGNLRKCALAVAVGISGHAGAAILAGPEYDALSALFDSTGGTDWTNHTNWKAGDACQWYGVVCDASQQHVIELNLADNHLVGQLTPLTALAFVHQIDISRNGLQGAMPNPSGLLSLMRLHVNNNSLSGSIPALSSLPNLQHLDLHGNQFSSWPGLSAPNFPVLEFVDISHNLITGTLADPGGLAMLKEFHANDNLFVGALPMFASLPQLKLLDVHDNALTQWGTLALGGLSHLVYFDASHNQISGAVPNISGLAEIKNFYINDNRLIGVLPATTSVPSLQRYDVHNNVGVNAWGAFNFDGMPMLVYFDASHDSIGGTLPDTAQLAYLREFHVNDNRLNGSLPSFAMSSGLQVLDLHDNGLSSFGAFAFSSVPSLVYFDASNNFIAGHLPAVQALIAVTHFYVDHNALSGPAPDLTPMASLLRIDLSWNMLTGALPNPPAPSALSPGDSQLCPNFFDYVPSSFWDVATGESPWFQRCGIDRIFAEGFELP